MSCLDVLRVPAVEGAQGESHPGFTAKYGIDRLVWYEPHASIESAFVRERQIKKWKRDWKIQLIEADNPQWIDLYPSIAL
jgi:putative endonuclease